MASPSPSTVLDTSALRTKWKTAKAAAEKAAGKNEGSKLAALHKEKMKDRLGPDLEDWPKLYPNWSKLEHQKGELDKKIDTYSKAVKESGLTDGVKNPMLLALKEIKAAMAARGKGRTAAQYGCQSRNEGVEGTAAPSPSQMGSRLV
jgi:hypothetical protein